MTDTAICRSCGNSGRDMFGHACVCPYGRKPDPNDLESALRDAKAKVLEYAQRSILLEHECKQMREVLEEMREWERCGCCPPTRAFQICNEVLTHAPETERALSLAKAREDVIQAARSWADAWHQDGPCAKQECDLADAIQRLDELENS